ncbi:MAG: biotin transporter BioY [Clostridiales Family XIII bacterium]|jgi:biotin transport system substrate-specific component|nr:biotin transporter BioY [Clostridiales Family XIII bacterium]
MSNANDSAGALHTRTHLFILCGLFAALTAVCAVISLPLPFTPVPVSLATLAVLLAGGILGAKFGALSQVVYILLGAIGLPVFAGFTAGVGILAGPTGGYIVGYIAAASVVGLLCGRLKGAGIRAMAVLAGAMVLGMCACYALGTAWFMYLTNTPLLAALGLCVFPFIPGDLFKIVVAAFLCGRLRGFVSR